MKFSILIPTLDEEQSIVECLTALQSYRNKDCEVIVADGGSGDMTLILAKPLADKLIQSEKGRAIQMNAGAQCAAGDVIIFLHADTFLPHDALTIISNSMKDERRWGRFDVSLVGEQPMLKVIAWCMNWRSRLTGIATGDQAIFVDRQLFESIDGYPVLALMEDIALSTRLKQIHPPICIKSKVTSSGRRWEQCGVLKTILLMWCLRLRYFFGSDPETLAQLYHTGRLWKT